ncbi:MAG: hypothetical protein FWC64_06945 [Treponema sp.]|nr:hypothetical protein [Treponema sp.]
MRNLLDLQNKLYGQFEILCDPNLKGDNLKEKLSIAEGVNEYAKMIVANSMAMVKIAELTGVPLERLSLLPDVAEKPVIADGRRKSLLTRPEDRDI